MYKRPALTSVNDPRKGLAADGWWKGGGRERRPWCQGGIPATRGVRSGAFAEQCLPQKGCWAPLEQPSPCWGGSWWSLSQEQPCSQGHRWRWAPSPQGRQLAQSPAQPCSACALVWARVGCDSSAGCTGQQGSCFPVATTEWPATKQANLLEHCPSTLTNVGEFIVSNVFTIFCCLMYFFFIQPGFMAPVSVTPSLP